MKNLHKKRLKLDCAEMAVLYGGSFNESPVYSVAYLASYGITWLFKNAGEAYRSFYPLVLR